jgi:hypothetical protein
MALFPTMDAFGVQPQPDPNVVPVQQGGGDWNQFKRVPSAPAGPAPGGGLTYNPPGAKGGTAGGRVFQHVPPWINKDSMTGQDPDTKQWGVLTQDKYGFEFKPYPKEIQERINPEYDKVEIDVPGYGKRMVTRQTMEDMYKERAKASYDKDRGVLDAYEKENAPVWAQNRTALSMVDAYLARGVKSGWGEKLSLPARKALASTGWLTSEAQDQLDMQTAFQAQALKLAQAQRVAGTGSQTEKDYAYLLEQTPQLGNSPNANRLIAARMRQEHEYNERVHRARQAWVDSGKPLSTFTTEGTELDGMFPRYSHYNDPVRYAPKGANLNDPKVLETATRKAEAEWNKVFKRLPPGAVFIGPDGEYDMVPLPRAKDDPK